MTSRGSSLGLLGSRIMWLELLIALIGGAGGGAVGGWIALRATTRTLKHAEQQAHRQAAHAAAQSFYRAAQVCLRDLDYGANRELHLPELREAYDVLAFNADPETLQAAGDVHYVIEEANQVPATRERILKERGVLHGFMDAAISQGIWAPYKPRVPRGKRRGVRSSTKHPPEHPQTGEQEASAD